MRGGGGFTYQGTGGGGSVSISSTRVTHDDVFLRDNQGREHVLRLCDWDVACREGHDMQAVWLSRDGKNTDYLMVRNRTTDTVRWAHQPFVKLFRLFEPTWLWMGLAILAVVFIMGYSILLGLVALGLPVWLWMHQKRPAKASPTASGNCLRSRNASGRPHSPEARPTPSRCNKRRG